MLNQYNNATYQEKRYNQTNYTVYKNPMHWYKVYYLSIAKDSKWTAFSCHIHLPTFPNSFPLGFYQILSNYQFYTPNFFLNCNFSTPLTHALAIIFSGYGKEANKSNFGIIKSMN